MMNDCHCHDSDLVVQMMMIDRHYDYHVGMMMCHCDCHVHRMDDDHDLIGSHGRGQIRAGFVTYGERGFHRGSSTLSASVQDRDMVADIR